MICFFWRSMVFISRAVSAITGFSSGVLEGEIFSAGPSGGVTSVDVGLGSRNSGGTKVGAAGVPNGGGIGVGVGVCEGTDPPTGNDGNRGVEVVEVGEKEDCVAGGEVGVNTPL